MPNSNLTNAKKAKNDEFYTQFSDIQKEVESYLEYNPKTFKGKIVYSNCDDPFESNFFRYFVLNFNRLGLKRLISTSYKPSPVANSQLGLFGDDKTLQKSKGRPKIVANKFIINEVGDVDGDGSFTLEDIAKQLRANKNNEWSPLDGDGDFRSDECVELLKQSDIVVTNPPFSLFREYVAQLAKYNKKFLIIGSMNAITYKEIFPFIKSNKMWLGVNNGLKIYQAPDSSDQKNIYIGIDGNRYAKMGNTSWFTNLDHGRRHQPLKLMTISDNLKFNKKMKGKTEYEKYANYDAIEVSFTDAIPTDYNGEMGVPISFLDKYNPDQFEIIGISLTLAKPMSEIAKKGTYQQGGRRFYTTNQNKTYNRLFDRIVIKHKKK